MRDLPNILALEGAGAVYTQIINPSVAAYDAETGLFLGDARFRLTSSAEQALLDWLNYGIVPKSLVMMQSYFEPSEHHTPITPNTIYHQKGIARAMARDENIGVWVPVEGRVTYDWRSRSSEPPGNFISSIEFSNIGIDGPIGR